MIYDTSKGVLGALGHGWSLCNIADFVTNYPTRLTDRLYSLQVENRWCSEKHQNETHLSGLDIRVMVQH